MVTGGSVVKPFQFLVKGPEVVMCFGVLRFQFESFLVAGKGLFLSFQLIERQP